MRCGLSKKVTVWEIALIQKTRPFCLSTDGGETRRSSMESAETRRHSRARGALAPGIGSIERPGPSRRRHELDAGIGHAGRPRIGHQSNILPGLQPR